LDEKVGLLKIKIYYIGKSKKNHHSEVEVLYLKRIKNYMPIEIVALAPLKLSNKLSPSEIKAKEAAYFNAQLPSNESIILMDELGKSYTSMKFANFIEKQMSSGIRCLSFVLGGAYGFSEKFKNEHPQKLRLSDLTFSHHLARTVLLEQIYRSFTILNNEPYHNS